MVSKRCDMGFVHFVHPQYAVMGPKQVAAPKARGEHSAHACSVPRASAEGGGRPGMLQGASTGQGWQALGFSGSPKWVLSEIFGLVGRGTPPKGGVVVVSLGRAMNSSQKKEIALTPPIQSGSEILLFFVGVPFEVFPKSQQDMHQIEQSCFCYVFAADVGGSSPYVAEAPRRHFWWGKRSCRQSA